MKKSRSIADTKIHKVFNGTTEKGKKNEEKNEEKNEVSDILYSGLKEKATAISVGKSGKINCERKNTFGGILWNSITTTGSSLNTYNNCQFERQFRCLPIQFRREFLWKLVFFVLITVFWCLSLLAR